MRGETVALAAVDAYSENAGMGSANAVRICMAESLRFWRKVRPLQVESGAKGGAGRH